MILVSGRADMEMGDWDGDYVNIGKLEGKSRQEKTVMFRYMSRNQRKATLLATEEEKLVEVITELTDYLEEDLGRELDADGEDDLEVLYPKFSGAVEVKAKLFKDDKGYRRLCCVPSFVLGLAMAGRAGQHYKHCEWFGIGRLGSMLGECGGVSGMERSKDGMKLTMIMCLFSLWGTS
jgi:hypothetical protein